MSLVPITFVPNSAHITGFEKRGWVVKGQTVNVEQSGEAKRFMQVTLEYTFSCAARIGRIFAGLLVVLASLGLALFSSKVRDLFTRNRVELVQGCLLENYKAREIQQNFTQWTSADWSALPPAEVQKVDLATIPNLNNTDPNFLKKLSVKDILTAKQLQNFSFLTETQMTALETAIKAVPANELSQHIQDHSALVDAVASKTKDGELIAYLFPHLNTMNAPNFCGNKADQLKRLSVEQIVAGYKHLAVTDIDVLSDIQIASLAIKMGQMEQTERDKVFGAAASLVVTDALALALVKHEKLDAIPHLAPHLQTDGFFFVICPADKVAQLVQDCPWTTEQLLAFFNTPRVPATRKDILKGLPADKLNLMIPHFTKEHWLALGIDKIKGLDLTKLSDASLATLFAYAATLPAQPAPLAALELPVNKLQAIVPNLTSGHCVALGLEKIKGLDLTKLTAPSLDALIAYASNLPALNQGLPAHLSGMALPVNLLNAKVPTFTQAHWAALGMIQIGKLDLEKLAGSSQNPLVVYMKTLSPGATAILSGLQILQLHAKMPWGDLEQVVTNGQKQFLTAKQANGEVFEWFMNDGRTKEELEGMMPYFRETHWKALGWAKIKGKDLDLSKVSEASIGKFFDFWKGLPKTERALSDAQVQALAKSKYFSVGLRNNHLTHSQRQMLTQAGL